MVQLRTAQERKEERRRKLMKRDEEVYNKFLEYKKDYNLSDAVCLVANEYNISLPTVYTIRKRQEKILEAMSEAERGQ